MDNTLSVQIENLIPLPATFVSEDELAKNVLYDYYMDLLNDIYDTNIISTDDALEKLDLITGISDPNLRGAALASLGGVHTFTGNYVKAFSAFHKALNLTISSELRSVVYSEISVLFRKLGYKNEAIAILDQAMKLTRNEKLLCRLKTQKGYCFEELDPQKSTDLLAECLEYYESEKNQIRISRIKRHLGVVYLNLHEYDKAEEYFDDALAIATEHSLITVQHDVMNDKGWILIQQKKYDEARNLFDELIRKDLSPYEMGLALQNVGYLEYERHNYREAIKFHSQSLKLSTWYEMRDMAFEDYYKLGLCHEKLGELGLADHFYKQGYVELRKEIGLGLRIIGHREKLLDAYFEFLNRNQKIPHLDVDEEVFSFAMNKTLNQIRDIFHIALLSIHLERTKSAEELGRHLKINSRTYFLYQKKLGLRRGEPRKGILVENRQFAQYVESLTPLSWREVNKKFEDDLFTYLLAKYQHNKTKLAEALDVSYAQVTIKTRKR